MDKPLTLKKYQVDAIVKANKKSAVKLSDVEMRKVGRNLARAQNQKGGSK